MEILPTVCKTNINMSMFIIFSNILSFLTENCKSHVIVDRTFY